MEATEQNSAQKIPAAQNPTGQGSAKLVPKEQDATEEDPQDQKTVASGSIKGLAVQQEPPRPASLQASSKKRRVTNNEDVSGAPAKRPKTGQGKRHGSPTVKSVGFRPANRTPPTEEDLELTRPVQKAKPGAEGEENVEPEQDLEIDPSSTKATTSRRVSELRGNGTKRSSRTRHLEKVARRSEYGLRSGLRREWSMDS